MVPVYIALILCYIIYITVKTQSIILGTFATIVLIPYLYTEMHYVGIFWLPHLLILFSFAISLAYKKISLSHSQKLSIAIFYFLIGFSLLFTESNIILGLQWILRYTVPFLPLIFINAYLINTKRLISINTVFLHLLILQILLVVTWKYGINPLPNHRIYYGQMYDYAFGSFGITTIFGDFISVGILYYIFIRKNTFSRFKRASTYLLLLMLFILFIEANNNHLIPILFISIISTALISSLKISIRKSITILLGSIVLLFLFRVMISSNITYSGSINMGMTMEQSIEYGRRIFYDRLLYSDRYYSSSSIFEFIFNQNIFRQLIGSGPGSASSVVGLNTNYGFFQEMSTIGISGTSFTQSPTSTFMTVLTELGWIGVLVIYYLFFKLTLLLAKKAQKQPEYLNILAITIYWLLLSFIRDYINSAAFMAAIILILINYHTLESKNT